MTCVTMGSLENGVSNSYALISYLEDKGVRDDRHPHPRAITAQKLAEAAPVRGQRVAKTVLVSADGKARRAVLPANELVRPDRLAGILEADRVSLMPEVQFAGLFPDCEPGAEPPFGPLYGLPTVVDQALTKEPKILVRAGTHDEALEMGFDDYLAMEHPRIAAFGSPHLLDWPTQPDYP